MSTSASYLVKLNGDSNCSTVVVKSGDSSLAGEPVKLFALLSADKN
jgi:hypothetical protein